MRKFTDDVNREIFVKDLTGYLETKPKYKSAVLLSIFFIIEIGFVVVSLLSVLFAAYPAFLIIKMLIN